MPPFRLSLAPAAWLLANCGACSCYSSSGADPHVGMVRIPAGPVLIGSDWSACPYDSPLHEVAVSAFYIDVFEATNEEHKACVAAGACRRPVLSSSLTRADYYDSAAFAHYPVVGMDAWSDAHDYCAWRGKRLPTEAEWEKAARGGCEREGEAGTCDRFADARDYPWVGLEASCLWGNVAPDCAGGDTAAVGAFPRDVSPYGVRDMGGNVRESVSDYFLADYYAVSARSDPQGPTEEEARGRCPDMPVGAVCHVVRGDSFGGSVSDESGGLPLTCRSAASRINPDVGVRCALDAL